MIGALVALLAAAVPWNPLEMVALRDLTVARDRVLLALLTAGTIWLAFTGELWLALIGLWHLCTWRNHRLHPTILLWVAIGAMWALARMVPGWAWPWIAWSWLACAGWQVALSYRRWRSGDWSQLQRPRLGHRSKGTFGSPVLTAQFLAAVAPFCPWWGWPVLAAGLYTTWSYTAFLGVGVGFAMLAPRSALLGALALATVALLLWWNPRIRGQRLMEWTPRGDSVDGWGSRLTSVRLLSSEWWAGGWRVRLLGHGPGEASKHIRRWSSRLHTELPVGEAHCDPLQLLYEMGALGALAGVTFVVPVLLHLRVGDPWSACWLTLTVMSLGHWPLRHPALAPMWLAVSVKLLTT